MADSYNIDDILSEVKKRRDENEKKIKEKNEPQPATAAPTETLAPKEEPQPEPKPEPQPAAPTEALAPKEEPKPQPEPKPEAQPEPKQQSAANREQEGMMNLLDYAEEEEVPQALPPAEPEKAEPQKATAQAGAKAKNKKRNKVLTIVIAVLAVLIIGAGITAYSIVNGWINGIATDDTGDAEITETEWQGMQELVENFDPINETEATELASMEDMLKTWYYNGTPCSSSHVLNVMLIGEDTRDEEITEDDSRADAAILASVNIDTKQIMLTSVLRDSWSYYETEPGNPDTGRFSKLNESLAYGDLQTYLNAVEKLYKVQIDGYAIVNFDSFETIIDTLYPNGITLTLTEKEINEVNNNPDVYGDVYIEKTFEGKEGELLLTGEQALAYCRIRHIDSDGARADRQKTTLMKIYEDMQDAGNAKLLNLINELVPYVKTSFNRNDIIKIGKYALSQGWNKFEVDTQNFPEYNVKGGQFKDYNNLWIWKSDFPADAYYMQTRIYGRSSITLAQLRVNTKEVQRSGYFSKGDPATKATVRNEHYGEVTSVPSQNADEEEESTTTSN